MTMIGTSVRRDFISRANTLQEMSSSPPSSTIPLTAGNLLKTSRASLPLYAVSTLNLAVSMTSLRVEILPGNSRSMTRKQGLIMVILDANFPKWSLIIEEKFDQNQSTEWMPNCHWCVEFDPYFRGQAAGSRSEWGFRFQDSMQRPIPCRDSAVRVAR